MKKIMMTLAAVLCCTMTTTLITACGDDDDASSATGYTYEVQVETAKFKASNAEVTTLMNAFNAAIGYDGYMYKAYTTPQDDAMKNACAAVQHQYENSIKSVYVRFNLVRVTTNLVDNQVRQNQETIATYEFGDATKRNYVNYSYASNADEARKSLREMQDSLPEDIYKASTRTILALNYAFSNFFQKINGTYIENATDEAYVVSTCDSIFNAHANDTLAVSVTYAARKTGFLNDQTTELWRKTKQANQ